MTDPKPPGGSGPPPVDLAAQLKVQRDSFVHTFFKRGAEITEQLLADHDRLRSRIDELERENAALRTQLASDTAIRDLLRKIDDLEREKQTLLSTMQEAEVHSTQFIKNQAQIEEDLANLANLHVASNHLHSTLRLAMVVRHLRELLAQLVGARKFAIYLADESRNELVVVTGEGISGRDLVPIPYGTGGLDDPLRAAVERVYVTGVAQIEEGSLGTSAPLLPACIPMRVDDRAVGVIAIYSLLPQKDAFVAVDFELFKMLGVQAASALIGAQLFASASGRLPGVEVFQGLSPSILPKAEAP